MVNRGCGFGIAYIERRRTRFTLRIIGLRPGGNGGPLICEREYGSDFLWAFPFLPKTCDAHNIKTTAGLCFVKARALVWLLKLIAVVCGGLNVSLLEDRERERERGVSE